MQEFLATTVDKFLFRVATDRYYNATGVWALADGGVIRIGLSDFLQQRSGDVAFAEVKPEGTQLSVEDEIATIETIKVNIEIPSPIAGRVVRVNPAMEAAPEQINLDPYGEGWLCEIEPSNWEADRAVLLDAPTYVTRMKGEAEAEAKKS